MKGQKNPFELHERIPPGYYEKSIRNNPLQRYWHTRRFKSISSLIDHVDGEILDIGCADGTFTQVIFEKTRPEKIIGIDIIGSSIEYTKKRFSGQKKYEFLVADANKLPFVNNRFEAVFCLEALEHIFDPDHVLAEIKRVLKKDGYLIVLVPTDSFLFKIAWWVVLNTWGKHWRETHVQSFSQKNDLSKVIKKAGFVIEEDKKFLFGMLKAVKARKK